MAIFDCLQSGAAAPGKYQVNIYNVFITNDAIQGLLIPSLDNMKFNLIFDSFVG